MERSEPKGYIRARGGKLEAVLQVGSRKVRKATGLPVGQEQEAEAVLAEALAQLRAAEAPVVAAPQGPTFEAFAREVVEGRQKRGIKSWREEGQQLAHVYPLVGSMPLAAIRPARLVEVVRTLPSVRSKATGRLLAPRTVHHVAHSIKMVFREAVLQELVQQSPCIWRRSDLPKKLDLDDSKRLEGGFEPAEVERLISDPKVPEERRVLYALEFLTGMRTGEAAARRWKDWDESTSQLGRLTAATSYDTRNKREDGTKTGVTKLLPVHPTLAAMLTDWRASGWRRYTGREPKPEDLIVPSARGRFRNASVSGRLFDQDLKELGLRDRIHYESRSTFRSLALAGGAVLSDVDLLTHQSPRSASDFYRRINLLWPAMCRAVLAIRVRPPPAAPPPSIEEVTGEVTVDPVRIAEPERFPSVAAGLLLESARELGGSARESNPPTAPFSTIHRF